jgi:uncharacterized protein YndB with AHSA1/START domain
MNTRTISVVAEPTECRATIDVAATPERVFQALASREVTSWWVRPGVFDTREWTGDVRPGGQWKASGIGGGQPYSLEGEFLEVDPSRKLMHTWHLAGTPIPPSTVTYVLEPREGGTRIIFTHAGFPNREVSERNAAGWETSFNRLAEIL